MAAREFKLIEDSVHQRFLASTAKIQIFGGGFGNGKTATMCVKVIDLIRQYPGCNGLIARATFPKLNDTIRKEFKFWCPPSLISSFPESKNSDNTAKFVNGSAINFRYIAQQGKTTEQSTSNLLSATYDFVCVDQMEDPEITEKDFYDLLGRLRGNTVYRGTNPLMPKSGPRFMMLSVNPTGNWFYKRIIRPLKLYEEKGTITDELLCERDLEGRPILVDGKPILLVELFEAPTHANAHNLGADFIRTLESTYRGQMRDRFILGKWASYEGLVYPEYSQFDNMVTHQDMLNYLDDLQLRHVKVEWIEGYDYGLAAPSCYILAFVDLQGIVHMIDGFYKPEYKIAEQSEHIRSIRAKYGVPDNLIFADPSIFGRRSATSKVVGKTISGLFFEEPARLAFRRGNNDIKNGITKVGNYWEKRSFLTNPYTGDDVSPGMFVSDKLQFVDDEATSYMWKKEPDGTLVDEPVDKNDHAMDTIKYMLSESPDIATIIMKKITQPSYMRWRESDINEAVRKPRYAH